MIAVHRHSRLAASGIQRGREVPIHSPCVAHSGKHRHSNQGRHDKLPLPRHVGPAQEAARQARVVVGASMAMAQNSEAGHSASHFPADA